MEGDGKLLEGFGRFPHIVRATSDLPPKLTCINDQTWPTMICHGETTSHVDLILFAGLGLNSSKVASMLFWL